MSEIKHRANEARELGDNPIFKAVLQEVLDDAVNLFMNANSCIDIITEAHERVRAVETIRAVLRARIDAETVEDKKKAQHRE